MERGKHAIAIDAEVSKARRRLLGLFIGVTLFVCALIALECALPQQDDVPDGRNYGYVYSGTKSSSVAFNTAGSADDSVILFGSSELSTPASTVPQIPAAVFGTNDFGFDLMYVGEAYDQSLWQTIAAGAYSSASSNKKAIIITSPTWFVDGGLDNETFKLRFSYSLYRAFCENPDISDDSKQYVATRLVEQGIDESTVDAALRQTPIDALNDAILAGFDDLKLRNDLRSVRQYGLKDELKSSGAPTFVQLYAQAQADGEASSTNNDWGMDDDFYAESIEGRLDALKDSQSDETYKDTQEYSDFSCFLKVCREVGFEPLVVVAPLHGGFYDWAGVDAETREHCYERIRDIAEQHDVAIADFSDREYEKYFLFDIVHFGWTGWVSVEEAIYDYVSE